MKKPLCGFTLVELLVTVAIAAILLSTAAPSFQTLVMNNRMSAQVDGLINGLNYARNAALSGNVVTTVCPIGAANSTNCGIDWGAGWIVVNDPAGSATLLHSAPAMAGRPVLRAVALNGVAPASVIFDARGLASTSANFVVCDSRGAAFARSLHTLATGYVEAGQTPGQAVWGGALVCP